MYDLITWLLAEGEVEEAVQANGVIRTTGGVVLFFIWLLFRSGEESDKAN